MARGISRYNPTGHEDKEILWTRNYPTKLHLRELVTGKRKTVDWSELMVCYRVELTASEKIMGQYCISSFGDNE